MMKLLTTSVVRGSNQGDSHGGIYLIDFEQQTVDQKVDWNTTDIDWRGRGADRGLRGIAFDGETVYIAASDELFAYTPDFERIGSWRNPYLKHCHEIFIWERTLFLTSTGYDSILRFDLDDNSAMLSAVSPDLGAEAREQVEVSYDGETMSVAYNAYYLQEILRHLPKGDLEMSLKTPVSACLVRPVDQAEGETLTFLLMPLRLND